MQQEQQSSQRRGEEHDPFASGYSGLESGYTAGERAGQEYVLREQAQSYASDEEPAYPRTHPMSEHWEKVTNLPPRRSQKRWWGMIVATAIVFFILGSATTRMMGPGPGPAREFPLPMRKSIEMPRPGDDFHFGSAQYALIIQKQVSAALKMEPNAIREQLRQGKHLSDIAAEQGVSQETLQKAEAQALTDALNGAFKTDNEQSQQMIAQLEDNPRTIDGVVTSAFFMAQ